MNILNQEIQALQYTIAFHQNYKERFENAIQYTDLTLTEKREYEKRIEYHQQQIKKAAEELNIRLNEAKDL